MSMELVVLISFSDVFVISTREVRKRYDIQIYAASDVEW